MFLRIYSTLLNDWDRMDATEISGYSFSVLSSVNGLREKVSALSLRKIPNSQMSVPFSWFMVVKCLTVFLNHLLDLFTILILPLNPLPPLCMHTRRGSLGLACYDVVTTLLCPLWILVWVKNHTVVPDWKMAYSCSALRWCFFLLCRKRFFKIMTELINSAIYSE